MHAAKEEGKGRKKNKERKVELYQYAQTRAAYKQAYAYFLI